MVRVLWLLLMATTICAHAEGMKEYQMPETMLITHVQHPRIHIFNNLIQEVYGELGIDVTFQPIPAMRGLQILDQGISDADTARVGANMTNFANIIVVKPALAILEASLICQANIVCNSDVLREPAISVMASHGAEWVLSELSIEANILYDEKLLNVLNMLHKNRIQYAIYPTNLGIRKELEGRYQVINLKDINTHHVINKKHAALVPALQRGITARLSEFKPEL